MIFLKHPRRAVVVKRNPNGALGVIQQEFLAGLIFLSERPGGQGGARLVRLKRPYRLVFQATLGFVKRLVVLDQTLVTAKGFVDFKGIGPKIRAPLL